VSRQLVQHLVHYELPSKETEAERPVIEESAVWRTVEENVTCGLKWLLISSLAETGSSSKKSILLWDPKIHHRCNKSSQLNLFWDSIVILYVTIQSTDSLQIAVCSAWDWRLSQSVGPSAHKGIGYILERGLRDPVPYSRQESPRSHNYQSARGVSFLRHSLNPCGLPSPSPARSRCGKQQSPSILGADEEGTRIAAKAMS
jgi:hypothetical protein